ncbi:hypothetical protein ACHQM5_029501 [Ranunculus cassubicifolius]
MGKRVCVDGVLDDSRYNTPVPVIGLYITTATLVCLIFMAYDMYKAFHTRKRWLPCRLFCLNSTSLTLLSVTAKLPIDLTSPMPSAQDQLSKLSSTTLICISMGFFMPSIGVNREEDSLSNMIALSIFVTTVIINISLEMYTGVIFLFQAEHIVVMCCMLGLLTVMWFLARAISHQKKVFIENQKDLIQKGRPSMLERLKMCYLYGFNANPQFVPCKDPHSATIGFLCLVALVVMVEATFRALVMKEMKFCKGVSDYNFSVWVIVTTQVITVIIGCCGTTFRWLAMVTQMNDDQCEKSKGKEYVNPILGIVTWDMTKRLFAISLRVGDFILLVVVFIPATLVNHFVQIFHGKCVRKSGENSVVDRFKDLASGDMGMDDWTLGKSVYEIKRLIKKTQKKPLNQLSQLLLKTPPSQELRTVELKDQVYFREGLDVSILSMVLLVRIAAVSLPSNLSVSLVRAFREANKILHFINERINFTSLKNKKKTELAALVWRGRDFHVLLPIIFGGSSIGEIEALSDIDRALFIIRKLKNALPSDLVWDEVGSIADFISNKSYSSIQELYDYIEQILVDMLHLFIAELPNVIYNEVAESPPEQYEARVKHCLRFIWKMQPLEDLVQWSFPIGSNISSLITIKVPSTEISNDTLVEDDQVPSTRISKDSFKDCSVSPTPGDDHDIVIHIN